MRCLWLIWTLLTWLATIMCTVGCLLPYWLKGYSQLQSEDSGERRLKNVTRLVDKTAQTLLVGGASNSLASIQVLVYPTDLGLFRRCGYPVYVKRSSAKTVSSSSSRQPVEWQSGCGHYSHLTQMPHLAWNLSFFFLLAACALLIFATFFLFLLGFALYLMSTHWIYQSCQAVLFIASTLILAACLLYPIGWTENEEIRQACGTDAHAFALGRCHLGWAFVLTGSSGFVALFAAILPSLFTNYLRKPRLPVSSDEADEAEEDKGSKVMQHHPIPYCPAHYYPPVGSNWNHAAFQSQQHLLHFGNAFPPPVADRRRHSLAGWSDRNGSCNSLFVPPQSPPAPDSCPSPVEQGLLSSTQQQRRRSVNIEEELGSNRSLAPHPSSSAIPMVKLPPANYRFSTGALLAPLLIHPYNHRVASPQPPPGCCYLPTTDPLLINVPEVEEERGEALRKVNGNGDLLEPASPTPQESCSNVKQQQDVASSSNSTCEPSPNTEKPSKYVNNGHDGNSRGIVESNNILDQEDIEFERPTMMMNALDYHPRVSSFQAYNESVHTSSREGLYTKVILIHLMMSGAVILELIMMYSILRCADVLGDWIKNREDTVTSVDKSSSSFLYDDDQLTQLKLYCLICYCFNPYSVLSLASMSTSIGSNLVIVWIFILYSQVGCYIRLYPGLLLLPILLHQSTICIRRTLLSISVFCLSLSTLLYSSYLLENGNWNFLRAVYMHQILVTDCTPNLGLYWYLFVEMFDHFHDLFVWMFQLINIATVALVAIKNFGKSVISQYKLLSQLLIDLADHENITHPRLPCKSACANILPQNLTIDHRLKLDHHRGQIGLVPPAGYAPSPRCVARNLVSHQRRRLVRPPRGDGDLTDSHVDNALGAIPDDDEMGCTYVLHPPRPAPLCENCQSAERDLFGSSSQVTSPVNLDPLTDLDDDDESRSWIFKQPPGPWWCDRCQAGINSPDLSVSDLFAVLRQWTPYAQLHLTDIVQEIYRRGANIDDRDAVTDMTVLHYASKSGALGDEDAACVVVGYVLDQGADIEARPNWTDMTPLHYAAYFDCPKLAQLLIERGADVESRSRLSDSATPLHLSASQLSLGTARVLLQASLFPPYKGKDSLDASQRTPYDCLPPVGQLPDPLCSIRERLAELLYVPPRPIGDQPKKNPPTNCMTDMEPCSVESSNSATDEEASGLLSSSTFPVSDQSSCQDGEVIATATICPIESSGNEPSTWLSAESGYLSPRNSRAESNTPSVQLRHKQQRRPSTAPTTSTTNRNLQLATSHHVSAKVTLQALNLHLGDRVCIGPATAGKTYSLGSRIGLLRYCGPVHFASGLWIGVELEEALGRNNGTVAGQQYFTCPPNHGIFAPIGRVYKADGDSWRCVTPSNRLPNSQSTGSLSKKSTTSDKTEVTDYSSASLTRVKAKVDTGLRPHTPVSSSPLSSSITPHFPVGSRVLFANLHRGLVRFVGPTQFAPGLWYGVELEEPLGRNDGSVLGQRYFTCPFGHGLFTSIRRLRPAGLLSGTPQLGRSAISTGQRRRASLGQQRSAWSTSTSPLVGRISNAPPQLPAELVEVAKVMGQQLTPSQKLHRRGQPTIDAAIVGSSDQQQHKASEPPFFIAAGMQVLCGGEIGCIRYIGPIAFADGIWLGLELRQPRGRHDGQVGDQRYFICPPKHGLLVRPSRVFCRGINGLDLLPTELANLERRLAEQRASAAASAGHQRKQ